MLTKKQKHKIFLTERMMDKLFFFTNYLYLHLSMYKSDNNLFIFYKLIEHFYSFLI